MPAIKLFIPSEIFDNMYKIIYAYGCTTHTTYNQKAISTKAKRPRKQKKERKPKHTRFGRKNWNQPKKSLHHGDLMGQIKSNSHII